MGDYIVRIIFYSIEKEFFPERKLNEHQIILNQKTFNHLKYEVFSESSDKISEI
jgi:hypothetical protein